MTEFERLSLMIQAANFKVLSLIALRLTGDPEARREIREIEREMMDIGEKIMELRVPE